MRRTILFASLLLTACGGGAGSSKPAETRLAANPAAITKMVQGVNAAKEPKAETRATALFKDALQLDPGLWEARYDLGIVLARSGDLAGAEQELKAAQKAAPDQEDVAVALGEVRLRRGLSRDAADGLEAFVKKTPGATRARTLFAIALRESGQADKAMNEAREVLARKPGDATALVELALSHLAKKERDTASLLVKQVLDANPKSAIALRANGLIQLAQGDDALAFQSFQKASAEDPRDTTSRLNMGSVLLRAGAFTKAEEQYRAILQIAPDDIDATVGLAAAMRGSADPKNMQKMEAVRALLERALERDPHHVSALFNMGVLYIDFLKRPQEGRVYVERFLSDAAGSHPSRAEAERYLAQAGPKAAPPRPEGSK